METKELLKEAVKAEVVKLMAQELLKEDIFEKMKSELAAELFGLKETVPEKIIDKSENKKEESKVFTRELNKDWGYDPINTKEEKFKQHLGFLVNFKDIHKGFKGKEISLEEKKFMDNSSFTKARLIEELTEKIKDLKKQSVHINKPYSKHETTNDDFKSEAETIDDVFKSESSLDKLKDFKERTYGIKREDLTTIPKTIIEGKKLEYVLDKQKEKLQTDFSNYITDHYKDIMPEDVHIVSSKPQSSSNTPDSSLKVKDKSVEFLKATTKLRRTPIKKEVGIVKEPSKKTSVKKASAKNKKNNK